MPKVCSTAIQIFYSMHVSVYLCTDAESEEKKQQQEGYEPWNLVTIGPVVTEEKLFEIVAGWTTRRTKPAYTISSL